MTATTQEAKQKKLGNITITQYEYNPRATQKLKKGHGFKDLTLCKETIEEYILNEYHSGSVDHYYPNKHISEHSEAFQKKYDKRLNAFKNVLTSTATVAVVATKDGQVVMGEQEASLLYQGEKLKNVEHYIL